MPFCVCVPARNEEAKLPVLLEALAHQDLGRVVPVLVVLNNTHDGSVAAIAAAQVRWRGRLRVQVETVTFPPALAHAGSARRHAMAIGAQALGRHPDAVLISTDADSRPPADWVRANLEALDAGADLVGGRLEIDDRDPLPAPLAASRALWDAYWSRVRALEDALDPVPCDPAPRHGDHTGASLALRVRTWRAAGGVPAIPTGEDRALVAAALAAGARLRHPPTVWTRVSGRSVGRAAGGMADHLAAEAGTLHAGRPILAPGFDQWRERALWRRAHRSELGPALYAAEARLPPMTDDRPLAELAGLFERVEPA